MSMFYLLNDDHSITPCSPEEWENQVKEMFKNKTKHVNEELVNGNRVSTVWLGLDHNHFGGEPLLFETMIFNSSGDDIYCERYSSWDEAVEGHKKAVQCVLDVQWGLDGCKDDQ